VRVEDPDVYRDTHARVLDLVADARVAGLRVDHIDGLVDPAGDRGPLRSAAAPVGPRAPAGRAQG
jgi:(1->4)-alpha-D-glucan 1-alpha-D-glucosylmutase